MEMELMLVIAVSLGILTLMVFMGRRSVQASQQKDAGILHATRDAIIDDNEQSVLGSSIPEESQEEEKNDGPAKEYLMEGDLMADDVMEYLKEHGFISTDFTDLQIDILENTKILCKYDDWSYNLVFSFNNNKGYIFFPKIVIPKESRSTHYTQHRLMFWGKINNYTGRYYFWEKSSSKKYFDRIRTDEDICLKNYQSLTLQKGGDKEIITSILNKFDNEPGLEIEIEDDDLFIKTFKSPNMNDLQRIQKILKSL